MANTPNDAPRRDDWQPEDLKTGKWETDEVKPAAKTSQAAGSMLGSLFGPLWNDPRARPLFLISMFLLIGVCALACFVVSLLALSGGGSGLGVFGDTKPPDPTAAALPMSDTLNVQINGTAIAPGVPTRLSIGDKIFDVTGLRLSSEGEWPAYDATSEKTAYWAGGTLVNYVIGLPANEANKALFDQLKPKDLILLDTGIGTLRYRISEVTAINADESGPLRNQSSPRVTLILMGEGGDTRRLIIAPYTDEATANTTAANGVPVNLGDVQVTALSERLVPGNSVGLPPGRNYYQVNLQITNLITRLLDASQFFTELTDGEGNKYVLSPSGSAASGAAGWAQGALQPGSTTTVTAGFEVPETMQGPTLTWQFAIDANSPYIARVALPYKALPVVPVATTPPEAVAEVNVLNANISPEGNELRVVGTIRNLTSEPLPVTLTDVQLSTASGALTPVNGTLPAVPWSVEPGQTLAFQINFARPPEGSGSVYFTLMGENFEIPGL